MNVLCMYVCMYVICTPVVNVHVIVLLKPEFEIMKAFLLNTYLIKVVTSMFHKISALVIISYTSV